VAGRQGFVGFHVVPMLSRFTKKALVNVPGRLVKTPNLDDL